MDISIKELLPIIDRVNLIDIRSVQKYNDNHIPNSINVSYEQILINPSKYLKKNETYYIYCQKGLTSRKVAQILNAQGYRVINIRGGYESWLMNRP